MCLGRQDPEVPAPPCPFSELLCAAGACHAVGRCMAEVSALVLLCVGVRAALLSRPPAGSGCEDQAPWLAFGSDAFTSLFVFLTF